MGIEVRDDGTRLLTSYPLIIPAVVGSGLSLLSLATMPSGYYQFSRFAITAMAVWALSSCVGRQRVGWSVAFSAVAVLYNPLIPVYMARESWALFNLVGGILFIVVGCTVKDSAEIATHAPTQIEMTPVNRQFTRPAEEASHSLPTQPRDESVLSSPAAQISVPAWYYFNEHPIAGSLTVFDGTLHFQSAGHFGHMQGNYGTTQSLLLTDVAAARLSVPAAEYFNTSSSIYTTYSKDAFFHLVLRTQTEQANIALGAGPDIEGTIHLLGEAIRQLEFANNGRPIRPLL